jgi:hypothetical protein
LVNEETLKEIVNLIISCEGEKEMADCIEEDVTKLILQAGVPAKGIRLMVIADEDESLSFEG